MTERTDREPLIELLKTIPQVNHAEAYVQGLDYVFGCAADYLISHGVTFEKQGEWKLKTTTPFYMYECSKCGEEWGHEAITYLNYCPNCGAKMKGEKR